MPGQSVFHKHFVKVTAIGEDYFGDQSFVAVVFVVVLKGDVLSETLVGNELLCFGAEGLVLFGAVDVFEAYGKFGIVFQDNEGIAIFYFYHFVGGGRSGGILFKGVRGGAVGFRAGDGSRKYTKQQ